MPKSKTLAEALAELVAEMPSRERVFWHANEHTFYDWLFSKATSLDERQEILFAKWSEQMTESERNNGQGR